MRYLRLDLAKAGMMLGADVLDSDGRILISRDLELTTQYIDRLRELGVPAVYIDDKYSEGIELEPPVSPVLRSEGLTAVKNMDIDGCRNVAKKIVQDMLKNGFHSLDMQDLRTYDDYTYAHSVNVAILSCTIGFGLNLNQDQLVDLVFAALLHDIGKTKIPEDILNKPTHLSQEEFALVKTHPMESYQMIENRLDISSMVKNAVLSHHENHDGSGYPNGLSEYNIALLARIIHVTDAYDALTSQRPYKLPYSPFAALEILEGGRGTQFDPILVDAFERYVPIYPKGTEIILADGTRGLVIENSGEHNKRPVIRTEAKELIDLASDEYSDAIVVSPSAQDYFDMLEEEEKRKLMTTPLPRFQIMVIDKVGDSFEQLQTKLNYLYEFRYARDEFMAEGFIKRDGLPNLLIIDIDFREIDEPEELAKLMERFTGRVPVLVLGSFRDVKTISMLRSAGIQNYILKPFKMIYLQSEIRAKIDYAYIS